MQLGDGVSNDGSVAGAITLSNNGTLAFAPFQSKTFANAINGGLRTTGNVVINGGGTTLSPATITFTGGYDSDFDGKTTTKAASADGTVPAGSLQLGDGTTTNNIYGDIVDNGILTFANAGGAVQSYTGNLTGHGVLNITTPVAAGTTNGAVVITASNSFNGTTNIGPNAMLLLGQSGTTAARGAGMISGTVNIAGGGNLYVVATTGRTLYGNITGAGSVTKSGNGTWTLVGSSNYTGGTTIVGNPSGNNRDNALDQVW